MTSRIYDGGVCRMDAGAAPFESASARATPFPTRFPLCPYYYCTCDADAERVNRTQCDWCFDKWYFERFVAKETTRVDDAWRDVSRAVYTTAAAPG